MMLARTTRSRARARRVNLIREAARHLEDAGLDHRHQRGAGHGADLDAIAERQHVERLRKITAPDSPAAAGWPIRSARMPPLFHSATCAPPDAAARRLFKDRIGDDVAERRLARLVVRLEQRRRDACRSVVGRSPRRTADNARSTR